MRSGKEPSPGIMSQTASLGSGARGYLWYLYYSSNPSQETWSLDPEISDLNRDSKSQEFFQYEYSARQEKREEKNAWQLGIPAVMQISHPERSLTSDELLHALESR